jgi:Arc/MetJ-type ribon-helix-helix transcriptional regulator
MTQLVARVPDELVREIDRLIAEGVVASRSDAVRTALEALVDRRRRTEIGAAIVAGYERRPQTEDEFAGADAATARMIEDEPW